jgi:hypothetical protein
MTCYETRSLLFVSWILIYWPWTMSKLSWIMSVVKLKTSIKAHKGKKNIHYGNTLIIRTELIGIYNTNVISKYPIYYYDPTTRTGPLLPAEINPNLINKIYLISTDFTWFALSCDRHFDGTSKYLRYEQELSYERRRVILIQNIQYKGEVQICE